MIAETNFTFPDKQGFIAAKYAMSIRFLTGWLW